MALSHKKYTYKDYYQSQERIRKSPHSVPTRRQRLINKTQNKTNSKASYAIILFCMFAAFFLSIPANKTFWGKYVINEFKNQHLGKNVEFNHHAKAKLQFANTIFLNKKLFSEANIENPEMQPLNLNSRMPRLQARLNTLVKQYPRLEAGVYVYDYETGNYAEINGEKSFPTASIIKVPILIQYFKRMEIGLTSLDDTFKMTSYYRTGGSGYLQYRPDNMEFDAATIARLMIRESDNSATNMLLSAVGGVNEMNMAFRRWGFTSSHMTNWLPDLYGGNVATPKDMATMLYNIDNPVFLSLESRVKIVEIMSKVRNTSLIRSAIPDNARFIHKTGDIGNMLGDAGVVYMPNGRKFAIVAMVNRSWNNPSAGNLIREASKIIYNSFETNDL